MKRFAALLTLMFAALPLAVLAQDATPGTTGATPEAVERTQATLFVRESGTLGRYFSTPDGLALYITEDDTVANQSTCRGECATIWLPIAATEPLSLPPDVPGELSLFDRDDGSTQLAYNGMPLYTFAGDAGPGSTLGNGIGETWRLATPGGQLGTPATPVVPTAVDKGTPRAAGSVPVSLREFYIQSAAVTFQTDFAYTFEITNLGDSEHQFVIEAAGAQQQPIETSDGAANVTTIAPGESATLIVVFPNPGNFQFASHANTDYEQGMALNIVVV